MPRRRSSNPTDTSLLQNQLREYLVDLESQLDLNSNTVAASIRSVRRWTNPISLINSNQNQGAQTVNDITIKEAPVALYQMPKEGVSTPSLIETIRERQKTLQEPAKELLEALERLSTTQGGSNTITEATRTYLRVLKETRGYTGTDLKHLLTYWCVFYDRTLDVQGYFGKDAQVPAAPEPMPLPDLTARSFMTRLLRGIGIQEESIMDSPFYTEYLEFLSSRHGMSTATLARLREDSRGGHLCNTPNIYLQSVGYVLRNLPQEQQIQLNKAFQDHFAMNFDSNLWRSAVWDIWQPRSTNFLEEGSYAFEKETRRLALKNGKEVLEFNMTEFLESAFIIIGEGAMWGSFARVSPHLNLDAIIRPGQASRVPSHVLRERLLSMTIAVVDFLLQSSAIGVSYQSSHDWRSAGFSTEYIWSGTFLWLEEFLLLTPRIDGLHPPFVVSRAQYPNYRERISNQSQSVSTSFPAKVILREYSHTPHSTPSRTRAAFTFDLATRRMVNIGSNYKLSYSTGKQVPVWFIGPKTQTVLEAGKGQLYFGTELEASVKPCYRNTSGNLNPTEHICNLLLHNYPTWASVMIATHDGSIDCGSEFVFKPMAPEVCLTFTQLFLENPIIQMMHQRSETCGFHIHVNRNYFSEMGFAKWFRFMGGANDNRPFVVMMAERETDRWARINYDKSLQDGIGLRTNRVSFNPHLTDTKYKAVNVATGRRTYEVRIFTGNPESILKNIEFTWASIRFATWVNRYRLSSGDFVNWLSRYSKDFPHMIQFLCQSAGVSGFDPDVLRKKLSWIAQPTQERFVKNLMKQDGSDVSQYKDEEAANLEEERKFIQRLTSKGSSQSDPGF